MPPSSERALALDFGRVLTLDPDKSTYDSILRRHGVASVAFSQAWNDHRHEYDRGSVTAASYWRAILNSCLPDLEEAEIPEVARELAEADFASWNQPRESLHDLIQEALDAGVPTAIVSNMPEGLGDRFVRQWPWLSRIPHRFFSAEIGLVKPEDSFYLYVLEKTTWLAHQVLFVDDLPVNIEAASRLGFETLLFTGDRADFEKIRSWFED